MCYPIRMSASMVLVWTLQLHWRWRMSLSSIYSLSSHHDVLKYYGVGRVVPYLHECFYGSGLDTSATLETENVTFLDTFTLIGPHTHITKNSKMLKRLLS